MKHPRYRTIKRMIFGCMIMAPLIPFALTLIIGFFYFDTSLETTTRATNERIVADHGRMIDSFLRERKTDLKFIIDATAYEEISSTPTLSRLFRLLQRESKAFVDIGVFNEAGDHVAYHGPFPLEGKNYGDAPWFIQVKDQGVYISDVFLGYRQVPHFIIALMRRDGDAQWIIRATIDTQLFNELVEGVRIGKTGEAYLTNADGLLQTRRRSMGRLMEKDPGFPGFPASTENVETVMGHSGPHDGFIYTATKLKEKDWILVVRQERADAFSALRSAGFRIMITAIIGGAIIFGAALFLSGYIVKKMEKTDQEKGELGLQLVRAGRLAELGEMSAGFAHEINNPLQIIKSELALIRVVWRDLKQTQFLKDDINAAQLGDCLVQIRQQVDRCGQITQGLLKFARQTDPVTQAIDLHAFLPGVIQMIAKQARVNNIAIEHRIPRNTPLIHGDPGQLQQVFLNLLNNASDAIRERHGAKGGRILIAASPGDNSGVKIHVEDNGCGISEENKDKIFSPFFTTKPVGKGTGLGLPVCYGIMENMGGSMDFSGNREAGTTFTLTLQKSKGDENETPCHTTGG